MPSSAPANHDPALSHTSTVPPSSSTASAGASLNNITPGDVQLANLDQSQIMSLLRHLPVFKLAEQGKEDAAQTLSNLAQAPFPQLPVQQHQYPGSHQHAGISDPGPSSHPRGPPNLGQLSAVAMQAAPVSVSGRTQQGNAQGQGQEMEEGVSDGDESANPGPASGGPKDSGTTSSTGVSIAGRHRGSRNAAMGSDEWSRQRKDNHKEVERRRRGNINEGINELGRIVPNGSGEKAKGAILSRAVQYIHHLKENEARNIEKWTLEKLLMDQAMGDLQAQLEEMRRMWEAERSAKQIAQRELDVLRETSSGGKENDDGMDGSTGPEGSGNKRRSDGEAEGAAEGAEGERDGKRLRVE